MSVYCKFQPSGQYTRQEFEQEVSRTTAFPAVLLRQGFAELSHRVNGLALVTGAGLLCWCLLAAPAAFAASATLQSILTQVHQNYLAGDLAAARMLLGQVAGPDRQTPAFLYESAILNDAAGRHAQARKLYDRLANTTEQSRASVPSAANLALLGRFAEARQAFDALAKNSRDARLETYAELWQLWLSARTYTGATADLQRQLAHAAARVQPADLQQRALLNLYSGKGNTDEVFAAIDGMAAGEALQHSDLRTEAAFFVGGYLQYARGDQAAALRLYQRELPQSSTASIERPLIRQAMAALRSASR